MIVIDASALLEILSRSPKGIELAALLAGAEIHAPHLIDLEILQTLRRWTFNGTLTAAHAEQAIVTFQSLRITRHAHTPLVPAIWALRHSLTAYDATYLALATALDAELVTMDGALRKLARRKRSN